MTQEEIIEGNKLIAEFMGVKWESQESIYHRYGLRFQYGNTPTKHSSYWHDIERLSYHSSWDWLMPVVEKIEELTYRFTISTTFVRVHTCKNSHDDVDEYHTGVFEGKLNTTWYAVVEFIKWYNQNKS